MVIELKRGLTGEHMELQAVRYAAMVSTLTLEQAAHAFAHFLAQTGEAVAVDVARERIVEHIEADDPEEEFGRDVRIVLVAEDFSLEVTSAIMWLSAKGVDMTAIQLAVHKLEDRLLLDFLQVIPFKGAEDYPVRVRNKEQEEQEIRRNKVAWNGEWYVAYGSGRPWGEARDYGFVSAGGRSASGRLYSLGLLRLQPGDRVWVNAPGQGYLGVAEVLQKAVPYDRFTVPVDGVPRSISEVTHYDWYGPEEDDAIEHFVAVKWLDNVADAADAFTEVGLFGNQNIVAQPRDPKWIHTITRLKERFPLWGSGEARSQE